MKRIIKIAISGGVCSGKTSCMKNLREHYQGSFGLVFVPESATILVNSGRDSRRSDTMYYFQESVLDLQLQNEDKYFKAAQALPEDTVLMFCDRGAADALGYLTEDEIQRLFTKTGLTESDLLSRYDAVIHLVTAADGAREFYTNQNNKARTETPEEAVELDRKIMNAWKNHKKQYIITNRAGFDEKLIDIFDVVDEIIKDNTRPPA